MDLKDFEDVVALVRTTLEKMDVAVDSVVLKGALPHPTILVTSADSAKLIGPHGETLKALNFIVKMLVEKKYGADARHFLLDVNDYEQTRIQELLQNAKLLAERVRTFHSDVELSPMNGYERMIIHAEFASDPDIMTESVGEGKTRRIVIKPRDKGNEFLGSSVQI